MLSRAAGVGCCEAIKLLVEAGATLNGTAGVSFGVCAVLARVPLGLMSFSSQPGSTVISIRAVLALPGAATVEPTCRTSPWQL